MIGVGSKVRLRTEDAIYEMARIESISNKAMTVRYPVAEWDDHGNMLVNHKQDFIKLRDVVRIQEIFE